MSVVLEFDRARHRYTVGGVVLASVTQVLEPEEQLDGIAPDVLEAGRLRGQHVHEACALLAHNNLDWRTLDPLLVPYVDACNRFLTHADLTVLLVEQRMYDPQLQIAGTMDLLGVINGKEWILDYKSGVVSRTWGPQLAAYEYLYRLHHGGRQRRRGVVQLRDDSSYRLIELSDSRDWSIFVSCLNLWHWRQRTGKKAA